MTWTSPRLSARDASFSHSLVKRWISISSGASARRSTRSAKAPAGVDGLELVGIADEQHLGARACGDPGEPIECRRVRERRLVDDHQLTARGVRFGRGRTRGATSPCSRTRRRGRRPTPGTPRRTAPDRPRSPARAPRSTPRGALASWWSCLLLRARRVGRPGVPSWQMLSTARRCCALSWTFPVAAARAATLAATVGAVTFSARANRRASASMTAVEEYFSPCRGRNRLVPSSRWNRDRADRELRRSQDHGPRLRRVDDHGRRRPRGPRSSRTAGPSSASTPRPSGSSASTPPASR